MTYADPVGKDGHLIFASTLRDGPWHDVVALGILDAHLMVIPVDHEHFEDPRVNAYDQTIARADAEERGMAPSPEVSAFTLRFVACANP